MIECTLIFPAEEDLPLGFITWARNSCEGVSVQLQFLETHTNVIVKGDCLTPFNDCIFYMGQWFSKILEAIPDDRIIKSGETPSVRYTDEKGGQKYLTAVVIDHKPETLSEKEVFNPGKSLSITLGEKEIFNPGKRKNLSQDEMIGPAMRIKDPSEAEKYLNDYIDFVMSNHSLKITRSQAEYICKSSLSAYSERCGKDVIERVEKLFYCSLKELKKLLKSK